MMRARPAELLPGTVRVISARMNYLPPQAQFASNLNNPAHAYISRYALGRDYHKLVRNQLKSWVRKSKPQLVSSVIGRLSTPRQFWSARWHRKPDWAGLANTH